jgi:hypothetical protein
LIATPKIAPPDCLLCGRRRVHFLGIFVPKRWPFTPRPYVLCGKCTRKPGWAVAVERKLLGQEVN